jgi:hypothetical protein
MKDKNRLDIPLEFARKLLTVGKNRSIQQLSSSSNLQLHAVMLFNGQIKYYQYRNSIFLKIIKKNLNGIILEKLLSSREGCRLAVTG